MKQFLRTGLIIVVVSMMITLPIQASSRVIADVEIIADHSAKVTLFWSDPLESKTIMITGWSFEERGLTLSYQTGSQLATGFNERVVEHGFYEFPMPIFLAENGVEVSPFTDMTLTSNHYTSFMNLYNRGIISGYPDGTFKPANLVTRAEFSKMLLLSANYNLDTSMTSMFKDVSESYWGKNYIMTLASREILKGKGDSKFDPQGQITIGEVLTVLTRTFDLYGDGVTYPTTLKDHWSNVYFLEAVSEGIATSKDSFYRPYNPNEKATRETCAILLSRVLENLHDVAK